MSFSNYKTIRAHWKINDSTVGRAISVRSLFSQDGFQELFRSFSFSWKSGAARLSTNFKKYWVPYTNIPIDESLVPTKTRSPLHVYIPRKPHPNGIKLWSVCDEATYFFAFSIFERPDTKETTSATLLRMADEIQRSEVVSTSISTVSSAVLKLLTGWKPEATASFVP